MHLIICSKAAHASWAVLIWCQIDHQFDPQSFVDSSRRRLLRRHLVESDRQIYVVLARLICFIPSESNQHLTSAELEFGFDLPKGHIPMTPFSRTERVVICGPCD